MALKIGLAEDRTGGHRPTERKEHCLTAAPDHQFDVRNPDWHHYNTNHPDELVFEFSSAGVVTELFSGSWHHVVLAQLC